MTGTAPAAPTHLHSGTITSTSIQVRWIDNATNETSYQLFHKSANGSTWTAINLPVNSTRWTLSGLTSGATHDFVVRACSDQGCTAWSNALMNARTR